MSVVEISPWGWTSTFEIKMADGGLLYNYLYIVEELSSGVVNAQHIISCSMMMRSDCDCNFIKMGEESDFCWLELEGRETFLKAESSPCGDGA